MKRSCKIDIRDSLFGGVFESVEVAEDSDNGLFQDCRDVYVCEKGSAARRREIQGLKMQLWYWPRLMLNFLLSDGEGMRRLDFNFGCCDAGRSHYSRSRSAAVSERCRISIEVIAIHCDLSLRFPSLCCGRLVADEV